MKVVCPCCNKEFEAPSSFNEEDISSLFNCVYCQSTLKKEGQSLKVIFKSSQTTSTDTHSLIKESADDEVVTDEGATDEGLLFNNSSDSGLSAEGSVGDAVVTDEAITNEVVTNEIVTNEGVTNEVVTDEIVTNEAVTDEVVTNEIVTNEGVTNEVVTDEVVTDEAVTNEVVTDEVVTNEGATDEGLLFNNPSDNSSLSDIGSSPNDDLSNESLFDNPNDNIDGSEELNTHSEINQDFTDVEKYGNSQATSEKGFLRYNLYIEGMDFADIEQQVSCILEDSRFNLDVKKILKSQKEGSLTIKDLNPIKAMCLISELSLLSFIQLSCEQYMSVNTKE